MDCLTRISIPQKDKSGRVAIGIGIGIGIGIAIATAIGFSQAKTDSDRDTDCDSDLNHPKLLAIPFCAGEPHARGDCSINGIKRIRVAIAIGFSPAKTDSDTDTDCDLRKISGEKFAKKPNAN